MLLTSRLQSRGITRKPDGSRGTSSDTAASTGAKTSWAHAPTAFSSTPLQSYFSIQPQPKKIRDIQKKPLPDVQKKTIRTHKYITPTRVILKSLSRSHVLVRGFRSLKTIYDIEVVPLSSFGEMKERCSTLAKRQV